VFSGAVKILLLFLLPAKGWGVYPCCSESREFRQKICSFLLEMMGFQNIAKLKISEAVYSFLPGFSFIYATCCCPVIAQAQQETRMKGRATNTHGWIVFSQWSSMR